MGQGRCLPSVMSSYRRGTQADSLPRSPPSMAPPVPERRFSYSRTPKPSKTMDSLDSREDQKKSLIELNNRLVSYVEKVRKLQEAADVIDSIPRTAETSESTLKSIKLQYGAEIDGWRAKYEEAQSLLAQLQNDLGNLKTENRQLSFKDEDKMGLLKERDQTIVTLETEISEVISKLNLLQSEKGRLIQNESVYKSDVSDLQSELEAMRKALDRERIRGGELEAKLASLDQDMAFQLQLKNTELEEERKRHHVDFSAIDTQMKSEYEKRLKAELVKLRRMYEEETEKAKQEFMYLHSSKVEELQEQLSRERSSNSSIVAEMKGILEKMDQFKRTIARLENEKLSLEQMLKDLEGKLEEQGQTFQAQMSSKEGEQKYEQLVEVKLSLEMEIQTYRSILEDEEKRIRRVSRKFSKSLANGGRGVAGEASSDSSSDSDNENGYRSVDATDGRRNVKKSSYSYSSTNMRSTHK